MPDMNFGTLVGEVQDFWYKVGMPRDAYSHASAGYMMIKKRTPRVDWEGGDGSALIKLPFRVGLPGAGSSKLSTAWNNKSMPSGIRWQITHGGWFQAAGVAWEALYLITRGGKAKGNVDPEQFQFETHPQRFNNVQSRFFWGNGGGAVGKGAGAGVAATGTTFTLKNRAGTHFFEAELQGQGQGDVIDFGSTDGTSGVLRGVTRRIVGKNHAAGTITLDATLTGSGVLDDDFVFFHGTHGADSTAKKPMTGVAAWNPTTHAAAATTFYGQDRSANVTKMAGSRVATTRGQDPWKVVLSILRRAYTESLDIDVIFVPPHLIDNFINSGRPIALSVGGPSGGRRGISYEGPTYGSPVRDDTDDARRSNAMDMRYGATGIAVMWPQRGKLVYLMADNYMIDITVAETSDEVYRGMLIDDWLCALGDMMPNWLNSDGNGVWYWEQGAETIGAVYGALGQYANRNPANLIVAGPGITES